jgi:hypothetical protein
MRARTLAQENSRFRTHHRSGSIYSLDRLAAVSLFLNRVQEEEVSRSLHYYVSVST